MERGYDCRVTTAAPSGRASPPTERVVRVLDFLAGRPEERFAYLEREGPMIEDVSTDPYVASYDTLRSALLRLPLRQRTALVLRYFEDLPDATIAELLRCRPATVRSLVARGLEALRTTPGVIT